MKEQYDFLEKKAKKIEKEMQGLPEGKLVISQSRNSFKWFRSDGHKKEYIKKQDRELAEALAKKKYLTLQLEETLQEKRAIQFYLDHHIEDIPKSIQLISKSSEYEKLLETYTKAENIKWEIWMKETYEKNPFYPEQLVHKTSSREYVRSKSEAIIYSYLQINKIPFRYECILKIEKESYYPDFTIRHPRTGKLYYWEHFGRMDDSKYAKKAFEKLEKYQSFGIIPGDNLIVTFETKDEPLSISMVEKIIDYYFI